MEAQLLIPYPNAVYDHNVPRPTYTEVFTGYFRQFVEAEHITEPTVEHLEAVDTKAIAYMQDLHIQGRWGEYRASEATETLCNSGELDLGLSHEWAMAREHVRAEGQVDRALQRRREEAALRAASCSLQQVEQSKTAVEPPTKLTLRNFLRIVFSKGA